MAIIGYQQLFMARAVISQVVLSFSYGPFHLSFANVEVNEGEIEMRQGRREIKAQDSGVICEARFLGSRLGWRWCAIHRPVSI
jgi:hypothetical protein